MDGVVPSDNPLGLDARWGSIPIGDVASGLPHEENSGGYVPGGEVGLQVEVESAARCVGQAQRCGAH